MKSMFALLLIGVLAGCSSPQFEPPLSPYQQQLAAVKQRSLDADFAQLRLHYTRTDNHQPHLDHEQQTAKQLFSLLDYGHYRRALQLAEQLLRDNYTSLYGHYCAMMCHQQRGDRERADYHSYVLSGLLCSIDASGDGRSTDSAFVTISAAELQAYLMLSGLQVERQRSFKQHQQTFDQLIVIDPALRDRYEVFFDISLSLARGPSQ